MAKSKSWKSLLLLAQLAVLFLMPVAEGDVCYYVTDISPVSGYGINEKAQIVGYLGDTAGLWDNGSVTPLGGLPGYLYTGAEGISDSGRYICAYAYNDDLAGGRGVLWTDGVMAELPPLPGDAGCAAVKVNDSGIAVGYSSPSGVYGDGSDLRAVYWDKGVPYELPTLGGLHGEALHITNGGLIVGQTQNANGDYVATLWTDGVPSEIGVIPGCDASWSRAINEAGQVGVNSGCTIDGVRVTKVALWDNGVFTEVEPLPGRPSAYSYGINLLGEIVGWSFVEHIPGEPDEMNGTFVDPRAMIWRDGVTYDLNSLIPADSGWELHCARDINDHGQIAGRGYVNGLKASCLLTPVPILTPELSGGATAEVVYDPYGNVGGYGAGLPGGSELVGGTAVLDDFQLTGEFATLMLHYDEADLVYDSIIEWTLRLYWYDDILSQWVLAGNDSNLTWNPLAQFVQGAPTDVLGDWGLNMADDYVWANIDHASTYSMGGQARVPAPSALISLCAGLALLGGWRLRKGS